MPNIEQSMNSRLQAVAVVVVVWAVIYLPALGSIAIKGEEGRRILPAIHMLETGNYIVPQV
jgi:4-amino-4-deoxy-L-arabinose transferase-like glycosyltransferase